MPGTHDVLARELKGILDMLVGWWKLLVLRNVAAVAD